MLWDLPSNEHAYKIAILVSSGDDAGSGSVLSLVLFHPPPEPERPRGGTRAGAFKGSRPPFGAPPPDGRRGEKTKRRGSGERDSPISALEPSPAMSIAFDGRESGINFSPNHCQFGKSPLFPALVEREEGDSLEQEDRRENEGSLLRRRRRDEPASFTTRRIFSLRFGANMFSSPLPSRSFALSLELWG